MRLIAMTLLLLFVTALPTWADSLAACSARGAQLGQRAKKFSGDAMMKRLIDADLKRANKEAAEGDADECTEALDHATKLLDGSAA
ncbi:hypothetical protein [Rhodopila sp.]|uniref:hypothetical protein n=1 Tax=Rhodopila sp. TaxID=2480087 RepID=UPI003D11D9B1